MCYHNCPFEQQLGKRAGECNWNYVNGSPEKSPLAHCHVLGQIDNTERARHDWEEDMKYDLRRDNEEEPCVGD